MQQTCPKCGNVNPPDNKFCRECGYALERKTEIETARPVMDAERKQATVLFCDLSGYTAMTERLDPEEVKEIMSRIFGEMAQVVAQYEGWIYQLIGDEAMIFFGLPKTHEDDPFRAIRAAREIHDRVEALSPQFEGRIGRCLAMHSGIQTGLVATGELILEKGVYGEITGVTVNLASRLSDLAKAGEILVGPETFRRTQGVFVFQALRPAQVQGVARAIQAYKVLSAQGGKVPAIYLPGRMVSSEMVGRGRELNLLKLQVMKVINGQGSVVNLIGEAGIGKSRLMAELKRWEMMQQVVLLEGRAISMGGKLSFYPVIDLVRSWAQIREDEGETAAFRKLEANVRRVHPEQAEEILPFLGTLMGMRLAGRYAERVKGLEGEALEKLILKNLRELLAKASERIPLMVVTEDLHWADASSLGLLESLFRLAESHRILFVNLFRPGYRETSDRIVKMARERSPGYQVEIVFEPLDEQESEALINNMMKTVRLRPAVTEQIVKRAGGNPFFIEEVVRSFIDEGAVVLKGGGFQVTEKMGSIAIPNTINDVLMARIDRLEQRSRDLLRMASVVGRSFFSRILSEVASDVVDLEDRLSYLNEIQLIQEGRRMGEVEYSFKHALAQEAAYASISSLTRKELHLRVAHAIEKVFGERLHEFYGMLAYHYGRADSLDKVEEYLVKAGEEALKSSASSEALHYYEEALQLYLKKSGPDADPAKVARLERNIALALYNRGQHQEAIKHFDKALDYYWGKLPKNAVSVAIKLLPALEHFLVALYLPSLKFRKTPTERDIEIVDLLFKKTNSVSLNNAKRFFIEYFYLFRFISSFDLRGFKEGIRIFSMSSALFAYSGISFALSRKVLDAVRKSVNNDTINSIVYELCETVHLFLEGNWKALKDYDDKLVDRSCRIGEIYWASQYLFWHALGNISQGSFDKARGTVNRLHDLFEVYGNGLSEIFKYEVNTMLLIESGKPDYALIESEKGIAFEEKTRSGLWQLHVFQAWIHIIMGAIQEAQECLEKADKIRLQTQTAPYQLSSLFKTQSELDLYRLKEATRSGNRAEMDKFRRTTIKSISSLGRVARRVAYHRTDSYRLSGSYYWTINKHEKALRRWHRAIQEGERLGARPQLARLYFEVGKCLCESKDKHMKLDGLEGEEYLNRARALFEEIELEAGLEELGQVVERRAPKGR